MGGMAHALLRQEYAYSWLAALAPLQSGLWSLLDHSSSPLPKNCAHAEPPAQRHGNDTPSSDTAVASALGQPSEQGGPQRGGVEALDTHQVPHENDVQVSQASQDATTAIEAKPSEAAPLSEFDRQLQKAEADLTNFAQWVAVEKLLEKEVCISRLPTQALSIQCVRLVMCGMQTDGMA